MRPVATLLTLAVLAAGGCGLSDYQKRMDEQRERVEKFDEANRLLDDPIDVPTIPIPAAKEGEPKEDKAWPFDVYLRLPKGFGTKVKDKAAYGPQGYPFLFRFAGGSEAYGIFVAAAATVADTKDKKEQFGEYTLETFRSYIKLGLEDYCQRVLKIPPSLQERTKPVARDFKMLQPYPGSRLTYSYYLLTDEGAQLKDHNAFDVYLHVSERGGRQACIVIHRPLQNGGALPKSIEACLSTLDISGDASWRRTEFFKSKG